MASDRAHLNSRHDERDCRVGTATGQPCIHENAKTFILTKRRSAGDGQAVRRRGNLHL